jgi:hypothetical protein
MQIAEENKFKRYRERLKAKGLRQIHLWVPDTKQPGFADELRRQVASLKGAPEEQEALDFIEETADWSE